VATSTPSGRDAVLRAAVELLGGADLDQLLGFLSYRAVAAQAHVRPGTVEYHFGAKRELTLATVTEASTFWGDQDYDEILGALAALGDGSGDLAGLATAMSNELRRLSPGGPRPPALEGAATAVVAMVAAAPHDPDARTALREEEGRALASYGRLVEATLAATGRSCRHGYDVERIAQLTQSLAMGFMMVRRYDTENAPIDLFADAWLRLFLAVTRDVADNEPDAMVRVSAGYGLATAADTATRERLVEATQQVYAERGWLGLTGAAVGAAAGVPTVEVMRLLGDRRGLAAAVWAGRLPRLVRVLAHLDRSSDLEPVVRGFLDELVGTAREDMALTAAYVEGVLVAATTQVPGTQQPDDPRPLVPLPMLLAPFLGRRADQLDLEAVGLSAYDASALLVDHAMHLNATRPAWPAERVVAVTMATTYRGLTRQTTP
jgi:AcrR family transcriptional regulator